jgi:hypothetical protein
MLPILLLAKGGQMLLQQQAGPTTKTNGQKEKVTITCFIKRVGELT